MKNENNFELNESSNIIETVKNYPGTVEIFVKHGIPCLNCVAAQFEKLSDIAGEFGIAVKDLVKEIKNSKK